MKKINCYLSLIALLCVFVSCRKDFAQVDTLSYTLAVRYPSLYPQVFAAGATVTIKNTFTGEISKLTTNTDGEVNLQDIIPGVYTVMVNREITEEESQAITGRVGKAFLNASIASLRIQESGKTEIELRGGAIGGFVIKEFYYTGSRTPNNATYLYDGFVEIYNNSTDTLFAGGISFGATKPGSTIATKFLEDQQNVYLASLWTIPGTVGVDHPVAPGKSIVIAVDGINHKTDPKGNPNAPTDLGAGIADFETYFNPPGNSNDTDSPDVPNVTLIYSSSLTVFDWLPGVNGSGLVILSPDDYADYETVTEPGATAPTRYVKVSTDKVIDGVDCVANSTITLDKKRLPNTIDSGVAFVGGGVGTAKSVIRKVREEINGVKVLMDTNNSSSDFTINDSPSPKSYSK
ncbi:MAG: DUF4876 domain-containing protein [Sphingobacterium sp.]|jgi:hypothetical protein|nr:DUF4876 domain-containing protein [Sphingobacterium sp.]